MSAPVTSNKNKPKDSAGYATNSGSNARSGGTNSQVIPFKPGTKPSAGPNTGVFNSTLDRSTDPPAGKTPGGYQSDAPAAPPVDNANGKSPKASARPKTADSLPAEAVLGFGQKQQGPKTGKSTPFGSGSSLASYKQEIREKGKQYGLGPQASLQDITSHENLLKDAQNSWGLDLNADTPDFEILNRMDVARRREEGVKLGLGSNEVPTDLDLAWLKERKQQDEFQNDGFPRLF